MLLPVMLLPAAFGKISIARSSRIIGGADAINGRYPYAQISLQSDELNDTSRVVYPITRINSRSDEPSELDCLTVVGWGTTRFGDYSSYPDVFQEVNITYISNQDCKVTTNEHGQSYGEWITDDHLCAWEEGKDSCFGDSGSPLIKKGARIVEDIQVGIVSWGVDCAGPLPGVYSRLSFMYDWLRNTVCTFSEEPPLYMECELLLISPKNGTNGPAGPPSFLEKGDKNDPVENSPSMSASPAACFTSHSIQKVNLSHGCLFPQPAYTDETGREELWETGFYYYIVRRIHSRLYPIPNNWWRVGTNRIRTPQSKTTQSSHHVQHNDAT
eukprot:scaffold26676_cov137-Cylindrotheca_fusiformis.AAC.6